MLTTLALAQATQASLIHRYSFNETSGTTVKDSAGTADGEIKGEGAYFDGGQLMLPGLGNSADSPVSGYVDLPNHIINVLSNVTIETWVTWQVGGGAWQRIFDFGTSAGGEDVVDGNGGYLFLSPAGSANLRFAVRDPDTGSEPVQLTAATPLDVGVETCVTVTYDVAANVCRLYSNGVPVVTGPASVPLSKINDVNNWLGRSQWNDGMFLGSYNEFRIYDTAMNPVEAAASFTSGVANPSTGTDSLGALQAVILTVPKTLITEKDTMTATSTADFANFTGITLSGVPEATLTSDNPDVLTVDAKGLVTALKPGTAKLTLSYLGQTDQETINVNARQTGIAIAGALVVDLRASDTSDDPLVWENRVNPGAEDDFYASGAPTYVADVAGTGIAGVQFGATTPLADCYTGPLTTAELHGGSDRSIEVWTYNPSVADEETLVAWSHRGGPDGSNLSFNYGANATYGAVGHWGAADMGWSGAPAAGQWHYLVYTYDGVDTAKVYADGLLKTTRTVSGGLNTHPDMPIRIGAQSNTDGTDADFGQAYSGYVAMVRVHTGKLSDTDVANNFMFGPTLSQPGELQTVTLQTDRTTISGARAVGQARVIADYANLKNVSVTGFSTLESSDTNILTVAADGVYTAVKTGTATITATYLGRPASQLITITDPPPMGIKHRYSFNEPTTATTVEDSEGNADGVLKGTGAAFDGNGKLALPGGTSSAADPVAGYVDLPNGIISSLVNVSFEAWITWDGTSPSGWQRIFDFGTSAGGEDVVNGNGAYFFLSPAGNDNMRFAVRDPRTGGEPTQLTASAPLPTGVEVYVAATYDYTGNLAVLYSNAVQVASGPAAVPTSLINDVNNWLGRSQWDDTTFVGSYNEFRIWEGALSAEQVAAHLAAGPNEIPVSAEPPKLAIALSGANVVIGWPSASTGFVLESTAALGPGATWTAVDTASAIEQGGQKALTVPIEGTAKYYRMRK